MNIGQATAIFKHINTEQHTDDKKIQAINEVLNMATHNGITKADTMAALKFAMGCLMVSDINVHMLERRLKHLLQSDFIRSFDEVNLFTKEYKRDISEADGKIFYLCDGKKCENCTQGKTVDLCGHTTDVMHAKNFHYDGFAGYWEHPDEPATGSDPDNIRLIDANALIKLLNQKQVVGRFNTIELINNAPTINPKEFEPLIQEIIKILPDIVNACIDHLPEFIETNTHNCPYDNNVLCPYYPDGCGKCTYNNP